MIKKIIDIFISYWYGRVVSYTLFKQMRANKYSELTKRKERRNKYGR